MPQILVDHSAELHFDRQAFAKELHPLVAEVISSDIADCKTVFRPAADHLVGDGSTQRPLVLVEIKLLSGRSTELRAELTSRVLTLLESHVTAPVSLAVEVTELDRATYRAVHAAGE
ncbi:5-carboxymethyl-2-hydroxymuconate isomerase [Streptacidiphilus jiangxiensis]|uniref:5-carboxymethyl-2-hydroxymuconate isomerase n=1 Tax=Streptacidiphilus jiangxiensis TaxID=235985 RepID=A0A1H7LBJ4_STRJI|nr:5-carboxymethyl-2-hydroxymuconate isomerase [Streptacidiphilus jiangxiensis]